MTGAPERTRSHYAAILTLLRERGSQGVLGSELYDAPLYGRSPRNRISELRRDGHLIEGKAHSSSDWFYRLLYDNAGEEPGPAKAEVAWADRKPITGLPLFDAAAVQP